MVVLRLPKTAVPIYVVFSSHFGGVLFDSVFDDGSQLPLANAGFRSVKKVDFVSHVVFVLKLICLVIFAECFLVEFVSDNLGLFHCSSPDLLVFLIVFKHLLLTSILIFQKLAHFDIRLLVGTQLTFSARSLSN